MAVTTINTTPAEDARIQAWATASQLTPKQVMVAAIKAGLQAFEASQNAQTFAQGYTPINPG